MTTTTETRAQWSSPVGPLTLVADDRDRLSRLEFGESTGDRGPAPEGVLAQAVHQLDEYFAGTRRDFELELAPQGTPFQLAVWNALRTIPYGATASYGEIARAVSWCRATE